MEKEVAVLLPRLYTGGVARVAIELVERLEKIDGLNFTFFSNRKNNDWHEKLESEVYEFSPYPYPELAYHRPKIKRKLESYDLLWNHSTYLNKFGRLLDTPMLSVNHTYHSFRRPKWTARKIPLKNKLQRKLAKTGAEEMQHVERVIAVSEAIKDRTQNIYKAKSARIYNGGNSSWTEFSENDEGFIFSPDTTGKTIQRIGRDKPVKALGSGESSNVDWLGWVSDEKLARNYKECSFVVSDSWKEGFAVYVLEAMFCGKPIVLRDVGGNAEAVEHGETGFIAQNSKEFHEYVDKLWSNPGLREEMGRKAYERASSRFTWEQAAEQYLVEMNDLMGSEFSLDQ